MKSRLVDLFNYKKVDLSEYMIDFQVNEDYISNEMNRLVNRKSQWKDGEKIHLGDMVELTLVSKVKKYNRPKLNLAVGSKLFDAELEVALVGQKLGESVIINLSAGEVEVTVHSIKNKVIPDFTDQLVAEYGPEEINSKEEFRNYLIEEQYNEALKKVSYEVEEKIINELFRNSEFIIYKEDFKKCVDIELNRFSVISEIEGMDIKTMTKEDFAGKAPVESYWELLSLIHDSTWEYLQSYLVGKYFSESTGETVDLSNEAYEKQILEYVNYWKILEGDAKKINTYDGFVVEQYQMVFYQTIRKYYEKKLLKEN